MSDFMQLFKDETVGTVEALIGQAPSLELKEEQDLTIISNIIPPIVLLNITISGDADSSAMVALTPTLVTLLSDMMMGEEESNRDDVNDDDLDAAKEIVSNIFGAVGNTLSAQKELPVLSFNIESIKYVDENNEVSLENFSKMFVYNFNIADVNALFMFIIDDSLQNVLFGNNATNEGASKEMDFNESGENISLNSEELESERKRCY